MALELYKPNDATRWRGGLSVTVGGILAYGVYSLHEFLAGEFWAEDLTRGMLGDEFPISPRVILSLVLILATAALVWFLANNAKVVDFLIATEKEMGKVSWPPKQEVISSSIAVCATVLILALYLGLVDYGLVLFKDRIPWDNVWARLFGGGA